MSGDGRGLEGGKVWKMEGGEGYRRHCTKISNLIMLYYNQIVVFIHLSSMDKYVRKEKEIKTVLF